MGEGDVSARQKIPSKPSYGSPKVVKTPKGDEDRYSYEELMETCANIAAPLKEQSSNNKEKSLPNKRNCLQNRVLRWRNYKRLSSTNSQKFKP